MQALPLVSTIWGVLLFGEYYRSSKRTYLLLGAMLIMFAAGEQALAGSESLSAVLCCCSDSVMRCHSAQVLGLSDTRSSPATASIVSQARCLQRLQYVSLKLACHCCAAVGLLMGSAGHRQTS